jgi:hypothetical protein
MVEEQAESAFAELVAITLQIVAAKLVDDNHDYELGMGVVSGGEAGWDAAQQECKYRGTSRRLKKTTARR